MYFCSFLPLSTLIGIKPFKDNISMQLKERPAAKGGMYLY